MSKMKTVKYRGKEYEVPVWVRFMATDQDGSKYGYADRPTPDHSAGMFDPAEDYHGGFTASYRIPSASGDWANSLEEV